MPESVALAASWPTGLTLHDCSLLMLSCGARPVFNLFHCPTLRLSACGIRQLNCDNPF